jgi:hypothetical protein
MNFISNLWKPFELEFAKLEKDLSQQRTDIDDKIRFASAQVAVREQEAFSRFRSTISKKFTL